MSRSTIALSGTGDEAEGVAPERSRLMASVRQRDTKPEMAVRRVLHRIGCRFRLHRKGLPGRPDIVLGPRQKVIFVNGCFWHRHEGCRKATMPKTRQAFWQAKFEENKQRDSRNLERLKALGWESLVVWECETEDLKSLERKLRDFVGLG